MPTGAELEACKRTAELLERIRGFFGGVPISVNSWYRTPEYNAQVGGAKNSQHMKGMAVDFTVHGMKPAAVQKALLANVKTLGIGGLGNYQRFTHVDIGPRRTWRG